MFRPRFTLRCIRPVQQNIKNKQYVIPLLQCRPFHQTIVPLQENEPHGPPMDQLPKVPIVNPADKYKEDGERLHEYGTYLLTCLPKFIQKFTYCGYVNWDWFCSVWKDELTLLVAPSAIPVVMEFLRDHTNAQFRSLMDITGVDYPTRSNRFEVVYNLLSTRHNARIRVKTYADEVTPVPSIVPIFGGANWFPI